jgi:dTMP kinase
MASWATRLAGRFVVFDGPDGTGKSTQFERFARWCRASGVEVCETREPGGTAIGEQIRGVLLDPANTGMTTGCEMLLYMASRAQLVEQVVRPALAGGQLVLADRFVSSTLAYQGTGGGLDVDSIMTVGRVAVGETWPDVVVVFDVDEATAARRMGGGTEPTLFSDRMERKQRDFHRRVREGFLEQVRTAEPGRYLLIDARPDPDTIFAALLEALEARFADG